MSQATATETPRVGERVTTVPVRRRELRRLLRPLLMLGGIAVVIVGSLTFWISGGTKQYRAHHKNHPTHLFQQKKEQSRDLGLGRVHERPPGDQPRSPEEPRRVAERRESTGLERRRGPGNRSASDTIQSPPSSYSKRAGLPSEPTPSERRCSSRSLRLAPEVQA